nr:uncharacterized protein LOC129280538 [Lytechinus pictus]
MYSVNDELPEGFLDYHQKDTRTKKNRASSSKSARSSKRQYIIKEEDDGNDDDEELRSSRHRLRVRLVAVALVFTVAAFVAFGVALYFSSMEESSAILEPVIDEDLAAPPN